MDISVSVNANGNHTGRESGFWSGVGISHLVSMQLALLLLVLLLEQQLLLLLLLLFQPDRFGVSEPQVAENRYLPLPGGITLTTVHVVRSTL